MTKGLGGTIINYLQHPTIFSTLEGIARKSGMVVKIISLYLPASEATWQGSGVPGLALYFYKSARALYRRRRC